MWNIKILAVGSIKETYFKNAIAEYLKRLAFYARIEIVELSPQSFSAEGQKVKAILEEGRAILKYLDKQAQKGPVSVFVLDCLGQKITSEKFSQLIEPITRQMIFVIGGTQGLSDEILARPYTKLSLSPMTFTHEMARVILLEQLYRAVTIIKGIKYHY